LVLEVSRFYFLSKVRKGESRVFRKDELESRIRLLELSVVLLLFLGYLSLVKLSLALSSVWVRVWQFCKVSLLGLEPKVVRLELVSVCRQIRTKVLSLVELSVPFSFLLSSRVYLVILICY
jgi:hypothetical protein